MSAIVPSQLVKVINDLFPFTSTQKNGETITLDFSYAEALSGILQLLDNIPLELINLKDSEYADFILNVQAIRSAVRSFEQRGNVNPLKFLPGFNRLNPITIVRRSLEKCPDEFPPKSITELAFISDGDLRDNIRLDIHTAEKAFGNGSWKATTVIAGSAIEAILLWRLTQESPQDILSKTGLNYKKLVELSLHQLIEAAEKMGLIKQGTATLALLAKDFRNLIHPGRSKRLGQTCNKGTALTALAALEQVINDL